MAMDMGVLQPGLPVTHDNGTDGVGGGAAVGVGAGAGDAANPTGDSGNREMAALVMPLHAVLEDANQAALRSAERRRSVHKGAGDVLSASTGIMVPLAVNQELVEPKTPNQVVGGAPRARDIEHTMAAAAPHTRNLSSTPLQAAACRRALTRSERALLCRWCDEAAIYGRLLAAELRYARGWYYGTLLPFLMTSVVSGANNMGVTALLTTASLTCTAGLDIVTITLGAAQLAATMLYVLAHFFRFPSHVERCARAAAAWRLLNEDIYVELGLPAGEGSNAEELMHRLRIHHDAAMEATPPPSSCVYSWFVHWLATHADTALQIPDAFTERLHSTLDRLHTGDAIMRASACSPHSEAHKRSADPVAVVHMPENNTVVASTSTPPALAASTAGAGGGARVTAAADAPVQSDTGAAPTSVGSSPGETETVKSTRSGAALTKAYRGGAEWSVHMTSTLRH